MIFELLRSAWLRVKKRSPINSLQMHLGAAESALNEKIKIWHLHFIYLNVKRKSCTDLNCYFGHFPAFINIRPSPIFRYSS